MSQKNQLKTIRLFGALGKRYGLVHRLAVKTPAEAVRALCTNHPELRKELWDSEKHQVGYRVSVDSRDIDETELRYPMSREIHFTPVIMGAGSGVGKIIVGAVLIVAGIAVNYFSGGSLSFIGNPMIGAGVSFVLGGVIQLLSPVPKNDGPDEDEKNKASYVFNGPINTTAQGNPVPVGYGKLLVGSAVISAGIVIDDLSVTDPLIDPALLNWNKVGT